MKKILYLFWGLVVISSCTNDDFIETQPESTTNEIIHKKLTYEQVSNRMNEKNDFNKDLKNTFQENYISSTKSLIKTNDAEEEDSEILIDYLFDPIHDNETYSFVTHEFSGEGDYLEKFVLTVEEGEEKVALLRYYPTTDFSAPLFSGKIEVSTLDRSYVGESYIENGITITEQSNGYQTNSVNVDCETTISIKSTRCTNGGNHRYGVECTGPGAVNDAYLYVTSYTTCNTTVTSNAPVFSTLILEAPPESGGGGDGSNIVYEQFYQQLSPTLQNWLKTQPNTKNHLLEYLLRHRNSTYYENIAEDLIDFLANDDCLKTNFNPLTEFIVKEALNGNEFNTAEFINFWDNLTNNQKNIFQQYANKNKQYLNGAIRLKLEAEAFLRWAFPYLIENTDITIEYFEDWFVEGGDMSYSLMSEFLSDIKSPDLIIPTRRFKNNTRLNAIYNKAKQVANIKQYLENFDSQFSVAHLILDTKPFTDNSDANARTYEPEHYRIEIVFNENNLNRPWLDIARAMMHEVIHAEMYRVLLSLASTNGQIDKVDLENKLTTHNYPGLYEYYRIYGFQNMQHPQMADHYRGIIRTFLMQLDNTVTYAQADAMAWVGLQGTTAWNNLTTTQKNNIINTYNSWYNNAPINLP